MKRKDAILVNYFNGSLLNILHNIYSMSLYVMGLIIVLFGLVTGDFVTQTLGIIISVCGMLYVWYSTCRYALYQIPMDRKMKVVIDEAKKIALDDLSKERGEIVENDKLLRAFK